jgi:ABC-2 type transport system ATP-binding protein
MTELAIEIQALKKSYGKNVALNGLNLSVPRGALAGFVGLNGAGKSTTLKILLQMTKLDSGSVRLFGLDAAERGNSLDIRRRTAFVPEKKDLFPYMRVGEAVAFTKSFYPKWRTDLEKKYADAFELSYEQKIPTLSKGAMTKLQLLLALCRGTELLLLDEPTDGLDPLGVEVFLQALVSLAAEEGVTVLFSSHRLNEMEQVADYLCMIHKGRSLMNAPLDDLKASCRRVVMVFTNDSKPMASEFAVAGPVLQNGRTLTVLANGQVESVVAKAHTLQARSVEVQQLSLREMFLELVKGDAK